MLKRMTISEAVEALKRGELVAVPTETSYGIGCRAYDTDAVARVVRAKGRPAVKPLPVLITSVEVLRQHDFETPLLQLAEAFWPGPLTVVVPAFPGLASDVTAGTNMVGVRISTHPMARALVEGLGEPLVATSANRSGEPACSTAAACDDARLVGVAGVVDAGELPGGASTVVGLKDGALTIFREGPISEQALSEVWAGIRAVD